MALVDYLDSEDDEASTPPIKKRKVSGNDSDLPPLPATFLDQYSSTVRTSTQDDPTLHGGRKRVTPHVEGNWPTHVYLEWNPAPKDQELLEDLVSKIRASSVPKLQDDISRPGAASSIKVHSLLESDLGVSLPLHVSLSRPLVLKTEQRDPFLAGLKRALSESNVRAFTVQPRDLSWHSNENSTRWFLVLRLQPSPNAELRRLLEVCNALARDFKQPLLYENCVETSKPEVSEGDPFHISIGWSLQPPASKDVSKGSQRRRVSLGGDSGVPYDMLSKLSEIEIPFIDVKVRIGQDVHTMPLKSRRQSNVG